MATNVYIKNMRTNRLPQIQSPVALLFKDKGGLANHPLSCHPQGVFGSRESGRKGEKKRKKEKERENSRPVLYLSNVENEKSLLQDLL